jgi:hypothetical protein
MAGTETARISWKAITLAAMLLTAAGGCASVVSGRHAEVAINSYPPDAQVSVRDGRGRMVASAQTPAVVSLKRGAGFLKKAEYTATIEKPGFSAAHVPIESTLNPWLFGNVIFGGIPGLVIDPYTGAMWRPRTAAIHEELQPSNRPGPEIYPASHTQQQPEPSVAPEGVDR